MGDSQEGTAADDGKEAEIQAAAIDLLCQWLPFLSRDMCDDCSRFLSDRARRLVSSGTLPPFSHESSPKNSPKATSLYGDDKSQEVPSEAIPSQGSNAESEENASEAVLVEDEERVSPKSPWERTVPHSDNGSPEIRSSNTHMSWADMVQEDELDEDVAAVGSPSASATERAGSHGDGLKNEKQFLSRGRREYLRFMNVGRTKDFICLERVNGKIINIVEGLELHKGVFSAAEQRRIVDCVYKLQELGRWGNLQARTYSEPTKWMRGKGRITMQFGCCYNYAQDKDGNPPGIMREEAVDPFPPLFKVMIQRLVRWHVLPPSCIPDSCIVNIYEVGDCIPPHIDHHDFVRPFCTVSFLSECNIIFGTNLKILGPGDFAGPMAVPLPLGSVLVLNGRAADVAKHSIPGVPTKRISITFRKMDDTKRPFGFVPEPDLQNIQPYNPTNGKPTTSIINETLKEVWRRMNIFEVTLLIQGEPILLEATVVLEIDRGEDQGNLCPELTKILFIGIFVP